MLQSFFDFVINRSIKVPAKIITISIILFSLLIVDNIVGYTYYRNIEKKIAQFDRIAELKENKKLSFETHKTLDELELDINSRVNVLNRITGIIKSINIKDYIQSNKQDKEAVPRNNTLLFFMSNWFIIYFLFASLHAMIDKRNWGEGTTEKKAAINIFALILMLTVLSIIAYYLIGLIPMIGKGWTINYIVAALIQPAIFMFFVLFSSTSIENV